MNQMQLLPSRFLLLLLILVAGLLVFTNLDSLWSQSVDLAHHYALTYRISEQFHLIGSNDPTLGEMNYYPRLSHIFAAVIGWPLNSSLLGMQVVSLLSLAGIWGGFLYVLNTLPKPFGLLSTLSLAALLILNKIYFKLEVHGAELTGNFFYSQLVAQGIVVLAIGGAIYLEANSGRASAYAFLIGVIAVNTGIHVLPTLELLGVLTAMVAFNLYTESSQKRSTTASVVIYSVPFIALCGVIFNPAFSIMRKISENDGGLEFGRISYPLGLGLLCIIALGASVTLLILYQKSKPWFGHNAIKYLALYGASIAGLCLLQMTLVHFGSGSNYAVKKYAFGVISYLFLAGALGLGALTIRALPDTLLSKGSLSVDALIVATCFFIIFQSSLMPSQVFDLSNLLQLEKKLSNSVSMDVQDVPGKTNVIIGLDGWYPTINYMFSLAMSKTPRDLAIPDVLVDQNLNNYSKYGYIISSAGSAKYDTPECRVSQHAGISINKAECIAEKIKTTAKCESKTDLSESGLLDPNRITGFGLPEKEGRWIVGNVATYTCEMPAIPSKRLMVDMYPFLTSSLTSQSLKILINGQPVFNQIIRAIPAQPFEINLPTSGATAKMVITFETPNSASPEQLKVGQDGRMLSFFLKSLTFK